MKEDSKEWRKEGDKEKERRGRREGAGRREGGRQRLVMTPDLSY